jgi:hypothetical protein
MGVLKNIGIVLIAPVILSRAYIVDKRKKKAVMQANARSKAESRHIHVVQVNGRFIVGAREELRRYDKVGLKAVRRVSKSHLFDFDYRNSIVYTAK